MKNGSNSRTRFDLDFLDLHDEAQPVDIREGDAILARMRLRDSQTAFKQVKVWRTSERAIELAVEDEEFRTGSAVDLELIISSQRLYYEGLVISEETDNAELRRVGIRYARQVEAWGQDERRSSPRWFCEEHCHPICVISSPFVMGRPTLLKIKDISSFGMRMVCSVRATYLVPQLKVSATIELPTVGSFQANLEIVRVDFEKDRGEDALAIGVRFLGLKESNRSMLSQYLIEYSSAVSLEELKESGFTPPSPRRGVTYYYAKSEADIREVMRLRYKAHKAANNFAEGEFKFDESGFALADKIDENCRIAVGVFQGKIIATMRIHFGSLDTPLEHEGYIRWSDQLPRRDQVVEVSRFAIDPEFQTGDILLGIFQFAGITCIRPAQPWVVISSWEHMVSKYERIGFKRTGMTHREKFWVHDEQVLIMNAVDGIFGKGVDPFTWNVVWREVAQRWVESGAVVPKGINLHRYRLYSLFGVFSSLIERFRKRPTRKK
ncbi:MAG: hypothetical protein RIC89_03685 [Pseudomonadales bacterium]